jgi:YaiO family outer membrane protein
LRGSYYYSDVSSVGIILAAGQEATSLGQSVVLASIRSAAIVGRHRINADWALTYTFAHTRQGDFYQRNSTNVGVQYTF